MRISRLHLEQFRNIESLSVFPCETVNIIYGDNAQGKTNLLEAIWLLSGAKSFRGAKDADLIRFGESRALIESDFFCAGRQQTSKIQLEGKKTAWLNDIRQDSITAFAGIFTTVVFSPSHLGLVKDGPAGRRKFLDTSICQITPRYIGMIGQYQRILLQRNTLLKDISYASALLDTLDIWDEKLSALGGVIIRMRMEYTRRLQKEAEDIYKGISMERESFSLDYRPFELPVQEGQTQREISSLLLEKMMQNRSEDLRSGSTGIGPHRDDLEISINGRSVRSFGSQGQQRSSVLALKLAESRCIGDILGERPVILLDDVMSELDQNRREYLLNHLTGSQIFITCCDKGYFSRLEGGRVFRMEHGQLEQE
ncbi:MAG: DNA replication/repair protein RecF [Oscillospiraceae bacterium]|mgnify:FL=1|nr:DNA replication/repair protein RecF [Oscillospiraceae bacterium]MDD7040738.1 DNA replication/repair protein RecF [Oscillospiraceae bacterium]MDY2612106.1 DNA replication/repair protein RecF [Oscillospiraceae bacterium]